MASDCTTPTNGSNCTCVCSGCGGSVGHGHTQCGSMNCPNNRR